MIQISGFNGVSSNEPYMVRAEVLPPRTPATCVPRFVGNNPAAAGSEQPAAAPANVNTVFVVNRQQLARNYTTTLADATVTALRNRLNTFKTAGFPSSVLQVDAIPAVRDAYAGVECLPLESSAGQRRRRRGRRARTRSSRPPSRRCSTSCSSAATT